VRLREEASERSAEIAAAEQLVLVHVEGLCLGGERAWELCRSRLGSRAEGDVFVAATLAYDFPRQRLPALEEALAEAPKAGRRALEEGQRFSILRSQLAS
jgi:hypothetical protein